MDEVAGVGVPGLDERLSALLETGGVLGALVCTEDGLPLAAELRAGPDAEALAAAGSILGQLGRAALVGSGELEIAVLDASRLRLVVRPVQLGYLLLIVAPGAKMQPALQAARDAGETMNAAAAALAESAIT